MIILDSECFNILRTNPSPCQITKKPITLVNTHNKIYRHMTNKKKGKATKPPSTSNNTPQTPPTKTEEIGGPKGPEPTRHGDWHIKGRVSDF